VLYLLLGAFQQWVAQTSENGRYISCSVSLYLTSLAKPSKHTFNRIAKSQLTLKFLKKTNELIQEIDV
jgi:hypothetical protein